MTTTRIVEIVIILGSTYLMGVASGYRRATVSFNHEIASVHGHLADLQIQAADAKRVCEQLQPVPPDASPLKVTIIDDGGAKLRVESKVVK